MLLRKINAGLSLLITVMLVNHAGFLSAWMVSGGKFFKPDRRMSFALLAIMVIHGAICIAFGILGHKGAPKIEAKAYPKMNRANLLQRITGILMLLLVGLHIAGAANHFQHRILHAVVHPLFFAVTLVHTGISTNKALITLGVGNAKTIRIVGGVMKLVTGAILVAGVVGFWRCLFVGVRI